jgi:hypothetical protein
LDRPLEPDLNFQRRGGFAAPFVFRHACLHRKKLSLADSAKIKDKFPLGQFAGPKLT